MDSWNSFRATYHEVEVERHRYRTLFEMAPDGYLVTNRQGQIYYANRAAAALFHLPGDQLVGKPLVVLVAPTPVPGVSARCPAG